MQLDLLALAAPASPEDLFSAIWATAVLGVSKVRLDACEAERVTCKGTWGRIYAAFGLVAGAAEQYTAVATGADRDYFVIFFSPQLRVHGSRNNSQHMLHSSSRFISRLELHNVCLNCQE